VSKPEREQHVRKSTLAVDALARSENQHEALRYTVISAERAFAMRQMETDIFLEELERHEPNTEIRNAIRRAVAARLGQLAVRRDVAALAAIGGTGVVADAEPVDPEADHG
jgi:hypothetical protein